MDLTVALATFSLQNGIPHLPYSTMTERDTHIISLNGSNELSSHIADKDLVIQFCMSLLMRNETHEKI